MQGAGCRMFLIGNQEEVKQKAWTRVILSTLRLHTSVTLLYLLGHSERARGKTPSDVPAAGDLRAPGEKLAM